MPKNSNKPLVKEIPFLSLLKWMITSSFLNKLNKKDIARYNTRLIKGNFVKQMF